MKKFAIYDLNTTEFFDTEEEARKRAEEWLEDERENAKTSYNSASREELVRWLKADEFYRQSDDITLEIRLIAIDTEIFCDECGFELRDAPKHEGEDGVERLDTWRTDAVYLLGEDYIDSLLRTDSGADED